MRQIHRVCGVLEAAASEGPPIGGTGRRRDGRPAYSARRSVATSAAAVDMSGVLKDTAVKAARASLRRNDDTSERAETPLQLCTRSRHAEGREQRLVQVRAMASGLPAYRLDLEVKADVKLEALDRFLRQLWLECCGHLSVFRIGGGELLLSGVPTWGSRVRSALFADSRPSAAWVPRIGDALPLSGGPVIRIRFGSTTTLKLSVMTERTGRPGRSDTPARAKHPPFGRARSAGNQRPGCARIVFTRKETRSHAGSTGRSTHAASRKAFCQS